MRQFEMEARPDWHEIATSIVCEFCGAQKGQMCIEQLAGTPKARADYHSSRKQSAKIIWELKKIERTEERIEEDLDKLLPRILSSIKIHFHKGERMPQGPVVLAQGQSATATIDYLDQNGNLMSPSSTFTPPDVTYVMDNEAIASSAPQPDKQSDVVTWVSAGVANLTATVTGPNGPLTDTETVTCQPPVATTPVLSAIKINFTAPVAAPPVAAAAPKK